MCDELKWIAEGGSQVGVPAPVPAVAQGKSPLRDSRLAWIAAALFFLVTLGLASLLFSRRAPELPQTVRFAIFPPDKWSIAGTGALTTGATAPVATSPDGRQIAFVAVSAEGQAMLWVRSLDGLEARQLAGTEGATSPFWSPDNRSLGFFAGGKLKKIDISGGPAITLCDAPDNRGGTWSRDGVIVFAPTNTSALQRVPAEGGVPSTATPLGSGELGNIRPSFLPDGRHFLYSTIGPRSGTGGPIYLGSLDSTAHQMLLNATSANALYTTGYLLFVREATLVAQPFDARRMQLSGDAVPVADQVRLSGSAQPYAYFSASANGAVAYETGTAASNSQLIWFDRAGKQLGEFGDPAAYSDIELSPDGKRASFSLPDQFGKTRHIWVADVATGLRSRFTFDGDDEFTSIWSPDGSLVIFNSRRKGSLDLYQKSLSGAGSEEALYEDKFDKSPMGWSPDGKFIVFESYGFSRSNDLFVLPLAGDRKPSAFRQAQFSYREARISPDGRWVAYASTESGRTEIYVTPFPQAGGKWQISTAGGIDPRWRRDGTELFYLALDNKLMAASVNGKSAGFEVSADKPLFATRIVPRSGYQYDVSADCQRFLVNTAPEQEATTPITVVLNWSAGVKK